MSKNLTIDFIFTKNVLLRCAFLFKKDTCPSEKNRNLSNDLIYYYSSQLLPKNCFINPDFFTQIIPFIAISNCGQHRQLGHQLDCHPLVHHHHPSGVQLLLNPTTTSRPKTLKKPEGIIEDIIAEVKTLINDEDHLWKAVVTKEVLSPPPTLLEELARELDAPKQDGVTSLVNRDQFFIF